MSTANLGISTKLCWLNLHSQHLFPFDGNVLSLLECVCVCDQFTAAGFDSGWKLKYGQTLTVTQICPNFVRNSVYSA